MRNADRLLAMIFAAAALGACGKGNPTQNAAMADNAAPAEVETLPADESSETPSNELANGEDNPDVNDLANDSNAY